MADDLNAKLAADLTTSGNKQEEAAKVAGALLVEAGTDLETTGNWAAALAAFLKALKGISGPTLISLGLGAVSLIAAGMVYLHH